MSDLIRRGDILDALIEKGQKSKRYKWGDRWELNLFEIKEAVESIPSVEPEQKWIPVTEALPEEREWLGTKQFGTTISDEVYVTFENPKGERFCKHLSFQNGKLSRYDQSTIDAFYPEAKPIAWMPLPKPWRGDR